ncbi:MAG: DoxX family protein [Patescibacteria group bacterium]
MIPLFGLYDDVVLLVARVLLGAVLVAHGWPKVKGFKSTAEWLDSIGLKPGVLFAGIAVFIEFVGGLMLIFGLFTQLIAGLVVLQFLIIIAKINFKKGLVGGYELDLMILALGLALFALGGGGKSMDALFGIVIFW